MAADTDTLAWLDRKYPTDGLPASGGPWTRHGHPVSGVTVYALTPALMPPQAHCGGVPYCKQCAEDAARLRAAVAAAVEGERT